MNISLILKIIPLIFLSHTAAHAEKTDEPSDELHIPIGQVVAGKVRQNFKDPIDISIIVDPIAWSYPVITSEKAMAAKVGFLQIKLSRTISIDGNNGLAFGKWKSVSTRNEIQIYGNDFGRRIISIEPPMFAGADMAMGPLALPHKIVQFDDHPAAQGEAEFVFELARPKGIAFGVSYLQQNKIHVAFNFMREKTFIPGNLLDIITKDIEFKIEDGPIIGGYFGSEIKTKMVTLSKSIRIGEFSLNSFLTSEKFQKDFDIPDDSLSEPPTSDDSVSNGKKDIVVIAEKDKKTATPFVILGRDILHKCSYIKFDKSKRMITLSCLK